MTAPGADSRASQVKARDISLEIVRKGSGAPVLLLHGLQTISPTTPFLNMLSKRHDIIAPSHPGFGNSPRPENFEAVYDLVHLYLDLIDSLAIEKCSLVGLSFGGWIATEIATLRPSWLDKLVLVDAFGVKLGDRETPDFLDLFNSHPDEVRRRRWHDPAKFAPDYDEMSDDELTILARNWDALALYGWSPYMHNPRLKRWLGGVAAPTLVAWGENDGIVKQSHGRALASLIPAARFSAIPRAGHHPEIEQPEAFAATVLEFLDTKR